MKCEENHTSCPTGYLEWHNWAEEKAKTHKQIKCPDCNDYSIWVVKSKQANGDKHTREALKMLTVDGLTAEAKSTSKFLDENPIKTK